MEYYNLQLELFILPIEVSALLVLEIVSLNNKIKKISVTQIDKIEL